MIRWGLSFLLIALLGAVLALIDAPEAGSGIAWTLFCVALLVSVIFFIAGRGRI